MGRKAKGRAHTKPKADLELPRRKPHGMAGIVPATSAASTPSLNLSRALKKRAKSGRLFHDSIERIEIEKEDGSKTHKYRGRTYRRPKAAAQ